MEVVEGTLKLCGGVDVSVECVKRSLRSNYYIVRYAFLFKQAHRGAVLIVEHVLLVVLSNHRLGVCKFAEVVLESLRPFIVAVVGECVVEIEISLCSVECDVLGVEYRAGVGNVTDSTDFLTINVEFDCRILS